MVRSAAGNKKIAPLWLRWPLRKAVISSHLKITLTAARYTAAIAIVRSARAISIPIAAKSLLLGVSDSQMQQQIKINIDAVKTA